MAAPDGELPFADLRQAECFLAVVEDGGITRAAGRLRVAQPSLSQAVRVIERQAGAALFTRTPRGAVPTAAGEALVEPARRLLAARASAAAAVSDVGALRGGRLEIVAHASVTADPLARAIGRFRRRHPGVEVLVEDARDDEELVSALTEARYELAVAYLPLPGTPAIATEELGVHDIWLAMAPDTPVGPGPVPLADVNRMPLVAVLHGGSSRRAVRRALADAAREADAAGEPDAGPAEEPGEAGATGAAPEGGFPAWAGVFTPHLGSVIPLVLTGAGAALVDRWYAERIAELGGVVRRIAPAVSCPYGVAHRRGALSPASAEFLRVLREVTSGRHERG